MSRGRGLLPQCIIIVFMTVTAGATLVILVTISSADSKCLPGPVQTQGLTAALSTLWIRAAHLPDRTAGPPWLSPDRTEKGFRGGKGKQAPSPHSWPLLVHVFPFTFSLFCPTEEAYCLHLKKEIH